MNRIAMSLIAVMMTAGARADTVHLTNGNQIEGRATVQEGWVKIDVSGGSVSVPREQVASIEKTPTVFDQYDKMHAALGPQDVAGRLDLAAWCRAKGLNKQNSELLAEVLTIEPNNSEARERLGYIREGAAWVRQPDLTVTGGVPQPTQMPPNMGGDYGTVPNAAYYYQDYPAWYPYGYPYVNDWPWWGWWPEVFIDSNPHRFRHDFDHDGDWDSRFGGGMWQRGDGDFDRFRREGDRDFRFGGGMWHRGDGDFDRFRDREPRNPPAAMHSAPAPVTPRQHAAPAPAPARAPAFRTPAPQAPAHVAPAPSRAQPQQRVFQMAPAPRSGGWSYSGGGGRGGGGGHRR